jgi:hypothetical protein
MWHAWERREVHRVLVRKSEGKRHLERQKRKWENRIKKVLREIDCEVVGRIDLAQDKDRWRPLVNTVINIRVLASRSELLALLVLILTLLIKLYTKLPSSMFVYRGLMMVGYQKPKHLTTYA